MTEEDEKGFQPKRTHYTLDFEGTELEGLRVKVSSMSIRNRLAFDELRWRECKNFQEVSKKQREILETFAGILIDWNLLDPDDGQPVGQDVDSILDQDPEYIQPVIDAWVNVITGPRKKLDPTTTTDTKEDRLSEIPTQDL